VEAKHYKRLDADRVQCLLCPHLCVLAPGGKGKCRVRINNEGTLQAAGYGEAVSVALDPIEKKPLFHFYPGREILSTGPNGCNLSCRFCQNWEISQVDGRPQHIEPQELVSLALEHRSIGIAYTYTEPLVWFEYLMDACRAAREKGLVNVLVTNGTINAGPLRELLPLVDAMNIDLKSMDAGFYRDVCGGDLNTVLKTIELAHGHCHVELTNLVISGLNDSDKDMGDLVDWTARLDPLVPLHLSRYFPQYKMDAPPTPEKTLAKFRQTAVQKLKYVYVGNIRIPGPRTRIARSAAAC
jgi:pyruvate formate lyase activating enzyme